MILEVWRRLARRFLLTIAICCSAGCAQNPARVDIASLPLLQVNGTAYTVQSALAATPMVYPLQLDDKTRALVDNYIDRTAGAQEQVQQLTRLILSESFVGLEYAPELTSTAADVARTGQGNCLGFSHLFIAMARHVGLDAHYRQLDVKPQWNRQGRWLLIEKHVNVQGKVRRDRVYTADIDSSMRYRQLRGRTLTDAEALALHYNNLAMDALLAGEVQQAWGMLVRGIDAAPEMDELWANLGTLYKTNGQSTAALWSYQRALDYNPSSTVALHHMQRLYHQLGQSHEAAQYTRRLSKIRTGDPYYQAWLAHVAAQQQDWTLASEAIGRAIALQPAEFDFHTAASRYHWQGGRQTLAHASLEQARQLARGKQKSLLSNLELQLAVAPRPQ